MTFALPSRRPLLSPAWATNDLWRRARAKPSLDLNFARAKSLTDAISGQNLITFTRASSATYVGSDGLIKTATTNEARFDHNPTTGESLGLLVEEARTNLWTSSNSAVNGDTWNNVGTLLNLTSGQSDPAGGTTGIQATDPDNVSAGTHLQRTSLANLTASTTVTYSIWLKPISCPNNSIALNVYANTTTDSLTAAFSVSGTTITSVSTSVTGTGTASGASFEAFPNGWYRCRLTGIPSTVTMADVRARINLGLYQHVSGTARFNWYGAQLEAGAFPTSYIPTTTAAATRSADVASITGTNFSSWYNQLEGTVFFQAETSEATGNPYILAINDGTNSNRFEFRRIGANNNSGLFAQTSSVNIINTGLAGAWTANSVARYAAALSQSSACHALNGTLTANVTPSGTFPVVTQALIGSTTAGSAVNRPIRRITFWPQRLPNSTLQALTQ